MDYHRKTSNRVKKELLKYAVNSDVLLDICCGRGGDMFKWDYHNIKNVIAIDNHLDSIKEAISRYKKCKIKTKVSYYYDDCFSMDYLKYTTKTTKTTKTPPKGVPSTTPPKGVDCVSCQFALHYCGGLDNTICKISDVLKDGGYFIGTAADGDIINNCVVNGITIPDVEIIGINNTQYSFDIINTTNSNDYFSFRNFKSVEYYLYKNVLIELCKKYNLVLVSIGNLKHNWSGNHISELYFSFVFKKTCPV